MLGSRLSDEWWAPESIRTSVLLVAQCHCDIRKCIAAAPSTCKRAKAMCLAFTAPRVGAKPTSVWTPVPNSVAMYVLKCDLMLHDMQQAALARSHATTRKVNSFN
jgi:hypothetical protein